ncbi:hypothetical protein LguiB_005623 [Lonicera macranthoides]
MPEDEATGLVFLAGLIWANPNNSLSLLVVQLTNFECGGMSIAVCLSHKLSDVTKKGEEFDDEEVQSLNNGSPNGDISLDASRYEGLTALLYKCGTSATTANSGFFSPTVMLHAVNMRPRVLPALPKTTMGNITSIFMTSTRNDSENNLKTLVEKIKKGNTTLRGVKKLDASEYLLMLQEFPYDKFKFFLCSSFCWMQLYKVDFG